MSPTDAGTLRVAGSQAAGDRSSAAARVGVSRFGALTHSNVSPDSFAHIGRYELQYGLRNVSSPD
jgi:hypothetical protein